MKKLMTALAVCAAASISLAAEPSVTSANIVGYSKVTLPAAQYTQLGVPFNAVTNLNGISVQDLFADPIGQGLKAGSGASTADQLQFWVWTGAAYDYRNLYLYDSTSTSSANMAKKNKWVNPGSVPDASWGTAAAASELKVTPGMAFWVKRATGSFASPLNLTIIGEVVMASTNARSIHEGYNLIAGSFTAPFVPNPDTAGTGAAIDWIAMGAKAGSGAATADQLQFWVWTGTAYDYRNLFLYDSTSTSSANMAKKNKWVNPGSVPDASWGTAAAASSYQHPIGGAFWYKRLAGQGSFTMNETRPYNP